MTDQYPSKFDTTKRQLGETDLLVSPVGIGCWPIAGMTSLGVNDADSLATLGAAFDCGINFVDTAHCYGAQGESETLVGRALAGRRDQVVLASKAGIHWDAQGVRHYDGRPETIVSQCEISLKRMNVDSIDLFYLHAADPDIPVSESAGAFLKLLESGKIRSAGASNLDANQLSRFHSVCPITAVQPPYNMLQRDIEASIVPWAEKNKASIVSYWPLMKGLLAGKIRRGHLFDPLDSRLEYDVFKGDSFETAQQLLDVLDQIAIETGKTVAQIVVNWTIHQPGITSVLCGAKRDWQIQETAGAMGWRLDESCLIQIEQCLANLPSRR